MAEEKSFLEKLRDLPNSWMTPEEKRRAKGTRVLSMPPPLPGPGGIGRAIIGKGVQSGLRRFGDVTKGDKTTQMKTRSGLERAAERPRPLEKKASGGTKTDRMSSVRDPKGPTKMKDRKGLERAPDRPRPLEKGARPVPPTNRLAGAGDRPRSFGGKVAAAGAATGAVAGGYYGAKGLSEARKGVAKDRKSPNADAQRSSYSQSNPTQRPYDASTSPKAKPPIPKAKPAKPEKKGKSKTRIAFEKEFAKARKAGKKEFKFRGGKFKSYNTKLAK